MAADILTALKDWSTTSASNAPQGSVAISTNLDDNLREIQGVIRRGLASYAAADLASAATVDLGSKEELFVSVAHSTGTTAITSFGTVAAGIWKIVRFSITGGTLTLTYNGTSMITHNASNYGQIANGDVLLCQSLGSGNWRVFPIWFNKPYFDTVGTIGAITAGNGLAVNTGNLGVSAGTITASGNITSTTGNIAATAGTISTSANSIIANKTGQTLYNTAGVISQASSGDAHIGLHAVGASAVSLRHPRGTNNLTIMHSDGSQLADFRCNQINVGAGSTAYFHATTNPTIQLATDVYFQSQASQTLYTFDTGDYFSYTRGTNQLDYMVNNGSKFRSTNDGSFYVLGGFGVLSGGEHQLRLSTDNDTYMYGNATAMGIYQTTGPRSYMYCSAGYFYSPVTYNNTTGVGANMVVAADGAMFRSVSLRQYKTDITPLSASGVFDNITPVSYKSVCEHDGNKTFYGFIAEDVAEAVPVAGVYSSDTNALENYSDRAMIAMLWAEVKALRARVAALEV